MRYARNSISKRVILFVLLAMLGNIALTPQASSVTSSLVLQAATPFPTFNYPPDLQTVFAAQQQDALTPFPTGTLQSFLPAVVYDTPFSTATPITPPPSTPAGDGVIWPFGGVWKPFGMDSLNGWYADINGKHVNIYAGFALSDNSQGMVLVTIDGLEDPGGGVYPTPNHSGAVHVVGAQGKRVILLSAQGETFYFDIPGQQFTASLTASVPTVTLLPTVFVPSLTPTLTGDAPHHADDVPSLSPSYVLLDAILYHTGDEHWFRFRTSIAGTLQVRLDNLPADYDLYVYSATRIAYVGHDGASTNPGLQPELVTIQNASPDDYMVRVVGINGAFDPVHSYTLEIDIPITADDLRARTGMCITDKGLLNSLDVKINHQDWIPFINQVEPQSGKEIAADCAHAMIGMAMYLLNNPPPTATPGLKK